MVAPEQAALRGVGSACHFARQLPRPRAAGCSPLLEVHPFSMYHSGPLSALPTSEEPSQFLQRHSADSPSGISAVPKLKASSLAFRNSREAPLTAVLCKH